MKKELNLPSNYDYSTQNLESVDEKRFVINDLEFEEGDFVQILGRDVSKTVLFVSLASILTTMLIWKQTGLLETPAGLGLASVYIMFSIFQLFSSSTLDGSISYENSLLFNIEQINASLLGTLALIQVFTKGNFGSGSESMTSMTSKSMTLFTICLTILAVNHIRVNTKNDGHSIRVVKEVKSALMNSAIFSLVGILIKGR